MKILKLRFKNLNSLVGEWQIDFTADEYRTEGIYAITGPTGAGKTTILDAICLALYGKTPRLEAINKNSNEIMSRQTAECYSEVIFATSEGIFLCHWGQHRARKKVDGNLLQQRHEISSFTDGKEGQLLEEKSSLVPKMVEEKTGLTFNQFTRSILLAQGNFDTFLKAESDKRAPILEQITGTEIYSQISIAVHERWKIERERLNTLKEHAGSVEILSEEAEHELNTKLHSSIKIEQDTTKKVTLAQKIFQWHQERQKQNLAITQIAENEVHLAQEKEDFSLQKVALEQAQKASKVEPLYTQLNYLENSHKAEHKKLIDSQIHAKEQKSSLKKSTFYTEECTKKLLVTQQEEERLRPLLAKARHLETTIAENLKQVQHAGTRLNDVKRGQDDLEKSIDRTEKEVTALNKHIQQTTDYLEKSTADKILVTELAAIEERLRQIEITVTEGKELRNKLHALDDDAKARQEVLANTAKDIANKTTETNTLKKHITTLKETQKNLLGSENLKSLNQQKDFLFKETQYIVKIIRLEDERQHLIDGKACPLCGATSHPFATEEKPELGPKEVELEEIKQRIAQIEKIDREIQQQTTFLHKEELLLAKATASQEQEIALNKNGEKDRADATKQLDNITATYKKLETTIITTLPHLELSALPADRQSFVADLRNRKALITEGEEKHQSLLLQQQKQKSDLESLKKNHADGALQFIKCGADLAREENTLKINREERSKFSFGAPDLVEKNLATQKNDASYALQKAQGAQTQSQEAIAGTLAIIATTEKNIAAKEQEIGVANNNFSKALVNHGFTDQESFLSARLSPEKLSVLEAYAKELAEKEITLKAKKDEANKQLSILNETPLSAKSMEEDLESLTVITKEHKEIQELLGRFKEQVAMNNRAKDKIAGFQQQLLAQDKEFSSWEELYNIIGSADGKKFRNFAQGLSFEQMVNHANRQLIKMSDRYLLTRDSDPKNPLGLQVIDNYQAGEKRSTKNLSGGESFIISLALALGLSHMASQKVRVDSLFLDEGFGTLDSEALETALTALANLQREDKLIGVISHISSLKERIPTQIEVCRMPGGKSTIQGPGCSKL